MFDEARVPDQGPWTVSESPDGRFSLFSDDFLHDAALRISGDFGSAESRKLYATYLADVLTRGCQRQQAARELADADLLHVLSRGNASNARELLERAADEIARLLVALAEADKTLEGLQVNEHRRQRLRDAATPSPFAQALRSALSREPSAAYSLGGADEPS